MLRRLPLFVLLSCVLTGVNYGSPFVPGAFATTDQEIYSQCALWMRQGMTMWVDMFDHKGPLTYLFYYVGLLGGPLGVWVLLLAWLVATMELSWRLCRLFFGPEASLAGAVYCALGVFLTNGTDKLPLLAMPFIGLALVPLLRAWRDHRQPAPKEVALAALCCLALFNIKPDLSAPIAAAGLLALGAAKPSWRVVNSDTAIFVAIFFAALLVLGTTLRHYGAWQEYVQAFWVFNFDYVAVNTLPQDRLCDTLRALFAYPIMALSWLVSLYAIYRRGRQVAVFAALAFATLLVTVVPSGLDYYHHCTAAFYFFGLTAAGAYEAARSERWSPRWLPGCALALMVAAVLGLQITRAPRHVLRDDDELCLLARWIDQHTAPDDPLLHFDRKSASLYRLTNRPPAARVFYQHCKVWRHPREWQRFLAELRESRPPVVVVCPGNLERLMPHLGNEYHVWPWSAERFVLLRFD